MEMTLAADWLVGGQMSIADSSLDAYTYVAHQAASTSSRTTP